MSARMLKKLQGEADKLAPPPDDELDNDHLTDNDELDTVRGNSHLNPFDLLNQQSLSESEFKEDDNETEHPSAALQANAAAKKKKKKRKKKTKSHGNHISSEDNERQDKYLEHLDPLYGKLHEATSNSKQSQKTSAASAAASIRKLASQKLLTVELKHLNQQNEMRRTFGKRVVKVENKRGRQKPSLKSTYIVTAKDSWPPLTKNIVTMKLLPSPDTPTTSTSPKIQINDEENVQWFSFQHSQYYQGIQHMFLSALERIDSEFLITLIKRCPYHVDSLVQLSEVCKMTEDFALASELIERALLLLESSLHINFSLTSGNSRLDYRRQENRAFFIVLFKHAQYLEERACCRTAFEISKLLLSLQPDVDPLAMILVIDYYALRSKQYGWLVEFYEQYNAARNLSQLPNMAYSYALALYTLHGSCERANEALQYALLMFPGVLRPLLDEMSVQTDKRVLASSYFFADVSGNQSPALHQLVCLYVCRAKIVYRQNDVLSWLETNVNSVLDRIDAKDPIVADCKEKRSLRYSGTPPRPILRHVVLSDYKEKVPLAVFVAKEKQAIMTYDPLPPADTVNCYQRKSSSSSSPTTNTNSSVSMFFQSLLPSFNLNNIAAQQQQQQQQPQQQQAGGVAGEENIDAADIVAQQRRLAQVAQGQAEETGLQQSLTLMMDAMRDFLHNFRTAETLRAPETAVAHSSSSNDDEEEGSSDYVD
ncbi:ribosome quality control complex subunit TCF25 [Drosophila sulfurigaster albostrigata]|uniref:ribosome quality control complex subunit TCF25 n=1 Tax=Drosophila sulfurigaster albostrigata TaxID=89887 RepID=UPI002D21EA15|nr:ribosome quality control complex subunit TCF25 [Drosophila sulfurigaster albostrigata]